MEYEVGTRGGGCKGTAAESTELYIITAVRWCNMGWLKLVCGVAMLVLSERQ